MVGTFAIVDRRLEPFSSSLAGINTRLRAKVGGRNPRVELTIRRPNCIPERPVVMPRWVLPEQLRAEVYLASERE